MAVIAQQLALQADRARVRQRASAQQTLHPARRSRALKKAGITLTTNQSLDLKATTLPDRGGGDPSSPTRTRS